MENKSDFQFTDKHLNRLKYNTCYTDESLPATLKDEDYKEPNQLEDDNGKSEYDFSLDENVPTISMDDLDDVYKSDYTQHLLIRLSPEVFRKFCVSNYCVGVLQCYFDVYEEDRKELIDHGKALQESTNTESARTDFFDEFLKKAKAYFFNLDVSSKIRVNLYITIFLTVMYERVVELQSREYIDEYADEDEDEDEYENEKRNEDESESESENEDEDGEKNKDESKDEGKDENKDKNEDKEKDKVAKEINSGEEDDNEGKNKNEQKTEDNEEIKKDFTEEESDETLDLQAAKRIKEQ